MLPRHQRLPRQRIEHIFKKGRKVPGNAFILKFLPASRPTSRFCVIVSAKVEPKAVKRNLVRRRIYEALRLNLKNLEKNHDVVIIASIKIAQSTYRQIETSILNLFQTLNHQK